MLFCRLGRQTFDELRLQRHRYSIDISVPIKSLREIDNSTFRKNGREIDESKHERVLY